MTARNEYGSLGEIIANSGATNSSIGYTGQRLDAESGLMALGNGERYYSPELGRFIQQDSWTGMLATAQSMNRFAYGYNNPFKFTDPSGNIADDNRGSLANSARNYGLDKDGNNNWWNVTKNFAARTGYDLWDTVSFGALSRQEEVVAKYENGEITAQQWQQMTIANAVVSGGQAALTFATGGAGTALTAGAGIVTRVTVGAGLGLAERFVSDNLEMAGGFREQYGSATEYAIAAGTGGLFGGASGGRAVSTFAKESKITLGTELRALKAEVGELARNPRQALGREAGEFWNNVKAEARKFASDETGSISLEKGNWRNTEYLNAKSEAEELTNNLKESLENKIVYRNPETKRIITAHENITMATAPVQVNGKWKVVVSSSSSLKSIPSEARTIIGNREIAMPSRINKTEPRYYRTSPRTGKEVSTHLHAEQKLLRWAKQNDYEVGDIFATRPYCSGCQNAINDWRDK